jgi:hypothetical protein
MRRGIAIKSAIAAPAKRVVTKPKREIFMGLFVYGADKNFEQKSLVNFFALEVS